MPEDLYGTDGPKQGKRGKMAAPKTPERDAKGRDKAPDAKKALGTVDSEAHRKWVGERKLEFEHYKDVCRPTWDMANRMLKLYLAKIEQSGPKRKEDAWMHEVFVPLPLSISEAKVATLVCGIMTTVDPLVQVEGVGKEDYEGARPIERMFDFLYRKNQWRGKTLPSLLRMTGIQGTEFFKLGYVEDVHVATFPVDRQKLEDWRKSMVDFMQVLQGTAMAGGPQAIMPNMEMVFRDPKVLRTWIDEMKKRGLKPPEPPAFGRQEVVRYRGPKIMRIPLSRVVLNPGIDEIDEQPVIFHQMAKSEDWLEAMVKRGKLDGNAVEECLKAKESGADGDQTDQTEHEQRIRELFGTSSRGPISDRFLKLHEKTHEVLEVFRPNAPDEMRYAVILNRKGAVNRSFELPQKHGMSPVRATRNIWVRGNFFGISDHQPTESVLNEYNTLRKLRLWRTTLETLPVFKRRKELGHLPELQRKLKPGGMVPVLDMDAISTLIDYKPTNAFSEMSLLQSNIEEGMGIDSSVRGREASVNRVPATESTNRLNQAKLRLILQAYLIEEELQPVNEQMLWIMLQKSKGDTILNIAGKKIEISQSMLLESLSQDFRFSGATRAMKSETEVQRLNEVVGMAAQVMQPQELREAAALALGILRFNHVDKVFDEDVTADMTRLSKLQLQMQETQLKMQLQQVAQQGIQAPDQVSAEQAQQLQGQGQGGGQGGGQPQGQGGGPGGAAQ